MTHMTQALYRVLGSLQQHWQAGKRQASVIACCGLLCFSSGAQLANAHDELYYPASMCQPVDLAGKPTSDIYFNNAVATNSHLTAHRMLVCPIPFDRSTDPTALIRVRVRVNDRASDASVRALICEKFNEDNGLNCGDNVFSGDDFVGFSTLEPTYAPDIHGTDTRFVMMHVEMPDSDTQTGTSYVMGYRVCRGSC